MTTLQGPPWWVSISKAFCMENVFVNKRDIDNCSAYFTFESLYLFNNQKNI